MANDYTESQGFNCSLQTLERIHDLIVDAAECRVHLDIYSYKANLYELYKETAPFLCKDTIHLKQNLKDQSMKKHHSDGCLINVAQTKWAEIEKDKIIIRNDTPVYEPTLITNLDAFDFWIKHLLKIKGLTFIGGSDPGAAIFN